MALSNHIQTLPDNGNLRCPRIRTIKKKFSPLPPPSLLPPSLPPFLPASSIEGKRKFEWRNNQQRELSAFVTYSFLCVLCHKRGKGDGGRWQPRGYLGEERRERRPRRFCMGQGAPPRVITRTSGTVSVQLSRQPRVHPIASAIRSVGVSLTTDIA